MIHLLTKKNSRSQRRAEISVQRRKRLWYASHHWEAHTCRLPTALLRQVLASRRKSKPFISFLRNKQQTNSGFESWFMGWERLKWTFRKQLHDLSLGKKITDSNTHTVNYCYRSTKSTSAVSLFVFW